MLIIRKKIYGVVNAKRCFGTTNAFALGIVAESPECSEDLQRIARPQGNAQNLKNTSKSPLI
jgi:hypothetical protein